jgi:POT family proton-dependent oligopeptide transporter
MNFEKNAVLETHLQKVGAEHVLVQGHPAGLFVLFFTEMWERFSYYGMRALLVNFLVSTIAQQGWGWTNSEAMKLYGLYTGMVFLTPLFGGIIADRLTGYKKSIMVGAIIMTLGHIAMALEGFNKSFFLAGLVLIVLGNGLFKPNISSMVGKLYPDKGGKKDAGYTIFYMGINGGAFLGMMLCGYIGEKIGWHYGFGLAGVFMFLGMLQFYFAQPIFGKI